MKSTATFLALLLSTTSAYSAGTHAHSHGDGIGEPGGDHIDRTIHVAMTEMAFMPGDLHIAAGETIRFVVKNTGEFVHEFNIATSEMHQAHEEEMMHMMDAGILEADRIRHDLMSESQMAHDDPNSVLLEPGQTSEIIWTFNGEAEIEISCNVPGHRGSGMIAAITIQGEQ